MSRQGRMRLPARGKMRIVTFASGSTGNCTLVSCGGSNIIIDAGISMKRVRENLRQSGLRPEDVNGILITHEHSDHISGLAMLIKHYRMPVYAPRTVADRLRYAVPGAADSLHVIPVGEEFCLGDAKVRAFYTPHDTDESVGYRIEAESIFALATDTGHVTAEILEGLDGADAVLIEANHDLEMLSGGNYPYYLKRRIMSPRGHLSNDDCAELARRLAERGTRYIVLGHLSRENNTPDVAYRTVSSALREYDVQLYTAPAADRMTLEVERREICSP